MDRDDLFQQAETGFRQSHRKPVSSLCGNKDPACQVAGLLPHNLFQAQFMPDSLFGSADNICSSILTAFFNSAFTAPRLHNNSSITHITISKFFFDFIVARSRLTTMWANSFLVKTHNFPSFPYLFCSRLDNFPVKQCLLVKHKQIFAGYQQKALSTAIYPPISCRTTKVSHAVSFSPIISN